MLCQWPIISALSITGLEVLNLSFLGGAGTVTGSKYLLEKDGRRILIDCGLFQGYKALRLRNWAGIAVPPASISAVVLTHAHLDHSGYLPLLVRRGFSGPVFCTEATASLCAILLPDSGHLQEKDAEFANQHKFSKHNPALPLYTEQDAERALKNLRPHQFGSTNVLPGGAEVTFLRAGHILGAATVVVEWDGCRIGFSGDIGRFGDPLMLEPMAPEKVDYLLMESTYGDREHDHTNPQDALANIITKTIHRGGTVIIPAFAVGRAQSLLYHIGQLKAAARLPKLLPVFLDSPMAIDATDIFLRHSADHRLSPELVKLMDGGVRYVHTGQESKELTASPMAKVIISASGMATGGRVLHHLEHYASDPKNSIIFAGFQAGGTRGAAMVAGATSIKMHGQNVPVRATVHNLSMLSAHADRHELLRWASMLKSPPKQAFVIHGEPNAADTLRHSLEEKLGWTCLVPDHLQQVTLA
jgi:metallo-beta-lactamase family protein